MLHATLLGFLGVLLATHQADGAIWRPPAPHEVADEWLHSPLAAITQRVQHYESAHQRVWERIERMERSSRGNQVSHAPLSMTFERRTAHGPFTYVGEAFIGTPPQKLALSFDMGSSDTMVLNRPISDHGFYDHSKSTSYKANGTDIPLYPPYHGLVSRDHITIGPVDRDDHIVAHDQLFMELDAPDEYLKVISCDGWLGLGAFPSSIGTPSFIRTLINQGELGHPVVGVHIEREKAHVMFGGIDATYAHGDIVYFPITKRYSWSVSISGMSVGGTAIPGGSGPLLLSTFDIAIGPQDQVFAMWDAIGVENGALPCDGPGPDITLKIREHLRVTLTKKDYAIPQGEGICQFAILPAPNAEFWMLGNLFLEKVYTVLDFGASESQQRVGLALVK